MNKVYIIGVGLTKFKKPSKENPDYPQMAKQATWRALHDAGINFKQIEQASVSYVYGDSTCGQRAIYEVGLTGIPIYNVNNNCSSGSSAIHMGHSLVKGGIYNCVIAVGFEKMSRGSLTLQFGDREAPLGPFFRKKDEWVGTPKGSEKAPWAPQFFGNAGKEHMEKFGTKPKHFAKIAYKNHLHSTNNPYSQFQDYYTLSQIEKSPTVYEFLTRLQCCPTSDGAGAVILANKDFVIANKLEDQAIEVCGMVMMTDTMETFDDTQKSSMNQAGYDMSKKAAEKLYMETNIGPEKIQVCELHDCFSANELITYEALGFCKPGKAGEFIDKGDNTYGGKIVVNPSGGLQSKGHPLGATGMAQCAELVWQLRGNAQKRQVQNVQYALQHNLGLGGAVVVGLYKKKNSNVTPRDDMSADPEYLQSLEDRGALIPQRDPVMALSTLPKPKL